MNFAVLVDILLYPGYLASSVLWQFPDSYGYCGRRRGDDSDFSLENGALVLAVQIGPEKPVFDPCVRRRGDQMNIAEYACSC